MDQHVGKHIFEKCIKGFLKEKTVVFVTHQLQYLSQVDHILVVKDNQIIEQGSYTELIQRNGHLANLVGAHLETVDTLETDDNNANTVQTAGKEKPFASLATKQSSLSGKKQSSHELHLSPRRLDSIRENLTPEQILNRKRFSISNNMHITDDNLAKAIESHQVSLMGTEPFSRSNSISAIERNRVSIVSGMINDPEDGDNTQEIIPDDAEAPMKLVLDDQSVNYKVSPVWSYLTSGGGVIVTLIIFVYFFAVHLVRILSGNFDLLVNLNI